MIDAISKVGRGGALFMAGISWGVLFHGELLSAGIGFGIAFLLWRSAKAAEANE